MLRFSKLNAAAFAFVLLTANAIPAIAADQSASVIILAQVKPEEGAADPVTPESAEVKTPLPGNEPEEGAADPVTPESAEVTTPLPGNEPEEGAADAVKPQ